MYLKGLFSCSVLRINRDILFNLFISLYYVFISVSLHQSQTRHCCKHHNGPHNSSLFLGPDKSYHFKVGPIYSPPSISQSHIPNIPTRSIFMQCTTYLPQYFIQFFYFIVYISFILPKWYKLHIGVSLRQLNTRHYYKHHNGPHNSSLFLVPDKSYNFTMGLIVLHPSLNLIYQIYPPRSIFMQCTTY